MGILDPSATTPPQQTTDIGYDIILLLGQSNMAGRGSGTDSRLDVTHGRIFQYGNSQTYANVISLAVEPLAHHESTGSTGVGPGLAFGRLYAQSVPTNRSVLLVPVAHGDTGFQTTSLTPGTNQRNPGVTGGGTWTPGAAGVNLFDNAVAQARAAITSGGGTSRVTCALWVQGEADAYVGSVLTQAQYSAALDNLIGQLRGSLGLPKLPFVIGSMTAPFIANGAGYTTLTSAPAAIDAAHQDTPRRTQYSYYVSAGNYGTDPSAGLIHFSAASQRRIGVNLFRGYQLARSNVTGQPPVPVAQPTLAQTSAAVVTVNWNAPAGRTTDYSIRYTTNGGTSWTILVDPVSAVTSATITGLPAAATVAAQVASINETGTSAWSPSSAALTLAQTPGQVTGLTLGVTGPYSQALTWTAVSQASTYQVQYRTPAGSGAFTTYSTPTGTSVTVGALHSGTSYDFQVLASNVAGTGTASATATATTTTVNPLATDLGATPFSAFGLRKLVPAFAGSAINVRRGSDSTTQDIGFNAYGELDTAALLTFTAGSAGYVTKWYDQSGSARDQVQATAGVQPLIVNTAGNLITAGGRAAVSFDGVAQFLAQAAAGLYAAGASSTFLVAAGNGLTGTASAVPFGECSTTAAKYIPNFTSAVPTPNAPQTLITNDTPTTLGNVVGTVLGYGGGLTQMSTTDSGTSFALWVGGVASIAATTYTRSGTVTLNKTTVGALNTAGTIKYYYPGLISEIVTVASVVAARTATETNQRTYFGL